MQTESLDMHIRWPELGTIFAVQKPSHMNQARTLSVQFFDRSGAAAFKVFLNFGGEPSAARQAQFQAVVERFRK